MDRNWITNSRKFTPSYTLGVEQFIKFVKLRSPEHAHISCPCTRCLNQSRRAQAVVHDHLLLFGMSAAYTRWTQHGECANAGNIEFSEQVRAHEYDSGFGFQEDESNHHDGIAMDEEPIMVMKICRMWR